MTMNHVIEEGALAPTTVLYCTYLLTPGAFFPRGFFFHLRRVGLDQYGKDHSDPSRDRWTEKIHQKSMRKLTCSPCALIFALSSGGPLLSGVRFSAIASRHVKRFGGGSLPAVQYGTSYGVQFSVPKCSFFQSFFVAVSQSSLCLWGCDIEEHTREAINVACHT